MREVKEQLVLSLGYWANVGAMDLLLRRLEGGTSLVKGIVNLILAESVSCDGGISHLEVSIRLVEMGQEQE